MLTGHCLCGAAGWRLEARPEAATACNCTACRRYGVLWAYGWEDNGLSTSGDTRAWHRPEAASMSFNHCPACGCLLFGRAFAPRADGRIRMAVNLRLADVPAEVADVPIRKFDGLGKFAPVPGDARCVADLWW
ncbi:GFA family protein [Oceanicola sp. D3]|uniref:GFA family protein n=1 Tax=Oceanicola sp. D3 TaxID=2587163 RepID=UPI00111F2A7C|nr:GFA family protein [Oceanicola sp. D3]QDC08419.1 GFA family protein [Oceanicola sp. D3]